MINFTLERNEGGIYIEICEPDGIRINGETHRESLLLTPDRLRRWSPQSFKELDAAVLNELLGPAADVVIIGTGRRQHYPDTKLLAPFINRGLGVEVMSSAAACRTFNILAAEGRQPVAGIVFELP